MDSVSWLVRDVVSHRSPIFWDPVLGVIPMPLIWNLMTVLLVALIFWWLLRGSHGRGEAESPENALKRRYVAGEIDRKTFLQMREDIRD